MDYSSKIIAVPEKCAKFLTDVPNPIDSNRSALTLIGEQVFMTR